MLLWTRGDRGTIAFGVECKMARVDHQGLALPMPDGMALYGWLRALMRCHIHMNDAQVARKLVLEANFVLIERGPLEIRCNHEERCWQRDAIDGGLRQLVEVLHCV